MGKAIILILFLLSCHRVWSASDLADLKKMANSGAYQKFVESSLDALAKKKSDKAIESLLDENLPAAYDAGFVLFDDAEKDLKAISFKSKTLSEVLTYLSDHKINSTDFLKDVRWEKRLASSVLSELFLSNKMSQALSLSKELGENVWQARIQFQNRNYIEAAKLYEDVPKSDPNYLVSRQELAWAYVHIGDWSRLRGLLVHVNSGLIPVESRMEGRVLSAMAQLKDCKYQEVQKEIRFFQSELAPLIKKNEIASNFASSKLSLEKRTLKSLETQNSKTSPMNHKISLLKQKIQRQEKLESENLRAVAMEAITKMQYVRLELLSQLQTVEKFQKKQDLLASSNRVADIGEENSRAILAKADQERIVFPVDKSDVWVDELFQLRSLSASECEALQKGTL